MKETFKANVYINGKDLATLHGLNAGGAAQRALVDSVIKWCTPYVPMKTGTLANVKVKTSTNRDTGEIIYEGPYAHYMYYGIVYGPNIWNEDQHIREAPAPYFSPKNKKKHPTGKELQYDTSVHELAGPFWFERMKADHLNDVLREVIGFVRAQQRRSAP